MPTHKIIALAIIVTIAACLGVLIISGRLNLSPAFLSGVMIGMLLPLGLMALVGTPKLVRSPKRENTPPV